MSKQEERKHKWAAKASGSSPLSQPPLGNAAATASAAVPGIAATLGAPQPAQHANHLHIANLSQPPLSPFAQPDDPPPLPAEPPPGPAEEIAGKGPSPPPLPSEPAPPTPDYPPVPPLPPSRPQSALPSPMPPPPLPQPSSKQGTTSASNISADPHATAAAAAPPNDQPDVVMSDVPMAGTASSSLPVAGSPDMSLLFAELERHNMQGPSSAQPHAPLTLASGNSMASAVTALAPISASQIAEAAAAVPAAEPRIVQQSIAEASGARSAIIADKVSKLAPLSTVRHSSGSSTPGSLSFSDSWKIGVGESIEPLESAQGSSQGFASLPEAPPLPASATVNQATAAPQDVTFAAHHSLPAAASDPVPHSDSLPRAESLSDMTLSQRLAQGSKAGAAKRVAGKSHGTAETTATEPVQSASMPPAASKAASATLQTKAQLDAAGPASLSAGIKDVTSATANKKPPVSSEVAQKVATAALATNAPAAQGKAAPAVVSAAAPQAKPAAATAAKPAAAAADVPKSASGILPTSSLMPLRSPPESPVTSKDAASQMPSVPALIQNMAMGPFPASATIRHQNVHLPSSIRTDSPSSAGLSPRDGPLQLSTPIPVHHNATNTALVSLMPPPPPRNIHHLLPPLPPAHDPSAPVIPFNPVHGASCDATIDNLSVHAPSTCPSSDLGPGTAIEALTPLNGLPAVQPEPMSIAPVPLIAASALQASPDQGIIAPSAMQASMLQTHTNDPGLGLGNEPSQAQPSAHELSNIDRPSASDGSAPTEFSSDAPGPAFLVGGAKPSAPARFALPVEHSIRAPGPSIFPRRALASSPKQTDLNSLGSAEAVPSGSVKPFKVSPTKQKKSHLATGNKLIQYPSELLEPAHEVLQTEAGELTSPEAIALYAAPADQTVGGLSNAQPDPAEHNGDHLHPPNGSHDLLPAQQHHDSAHSEPTLQPPLHPLPSPAKAQKLHGTKSKQSRSGEPGSHCKHPKESKSHRSSLHPSDAGRHSESSKGGPVHASTKAKLSRARPSRDFGDLSSAADTSTKYRRAGYLPRNAHGVPSSGTATGATLRCTATTKGGSSKLVKSSSAPSASGQKASGKGAGASLSNGVAAEGGALPPPPPLPKAASLPRAGSQGTLLPPPPALPAASQRPGPGADGPLPPPPPNPPGRVGVKRKTPAPLTGGLPAVVGAGASQQAKALGAAEEPAAKRPKIGAAAKAAQALQPPGRCGLSCSGLYCQLDCW